MWITPKINWTDEDYFNLNPDYTRIKGNIEHLFELSKELYIEYQMVNLGSYLISDYPTVGFFNNVIQSTYDILNKTYKPTTSGYMRYYESNQRAWNADELNVIEENHLRLYECFIEQKDALRKIEFELGGNEFGD